MAFRINTTLLLLLLLLIPISSGTVEGFSDRAKPTHSLHKDGVQMNSRKLLNSMLDYDDAGANPKHEPRKGKPGGGNGKSP